LELALDASAILPPDLWNLLMSFGIMVRGEAGNLQVDESGSYSFFKQKGTVTTTVPFGTANQGGKVNTYGDIVVTGCNSPILAIRSNVCCSYSLISTSGSTWTYRVYALGAAGQNTTGSVITYYVFDIHPPASSSQYGLRVYRPDGSIAFDSDHRVMSVKDFRIFGNANNAAETWAYSSPNLAFAMAAPGSFDVFTPTMETYSLIGARNNGNNIMVEPIVWRSTDVSGGPFLAITGQTSAGVLIVDVAGL
jgi:hypothetical protein